MANLDLHDLTNTPVHVRDVLGDWTRQETYGFVLGSIVDESSSKEKREALMAALEDDIELHAHGKDVNFAWWCPPELHSRESSGNGALITLTACYTLVPRCERG